MFNDFFFNLNDFFLYKFKEKNSYLMFEDINLKARARNKKN